MTEKYLRQEKATKKVRAGVERKEMKNQKLKKEQRERNK